MAKRLPWGHASRHCIYCGKVGPRTVVLGGYAHKYCLPKPAPKKPTRGVAGPGGETFLPADADGPQPDSVHSALPARQEVTAREDAKCHCETCRPNTIDDMRFIVCAICGNKRCPRATDHRNACTGSNAVGQRGSSWEHVKPWPVEEQPDGTITPVDPADLPAQARNGIADEPRSNEKDSAPVVQVVEPLTSAERFTIGLVYTVTLGDLERIQAACARKWGLSLKENT